ncbi:methyltransferase [Isoalcanivorax indicus]|uniref:methyltransferase n=1 Tax=Isoalcanivorax indicus TaxID=2202653 RepID=UPI000DB98201|nr:methyltransferase [Isoalcanivorax indicus]
MENTTRLLERQQALLAGRHALIVDADDAALAHLPAARITLHGELASLPLDQAQVLPDVPADTDLLIIILPKSRERLDLLLAALAGSITRPTECWLVGPGKGGIRGALKQFAALCGEPESLDSARHCKLFRGTLSPHPPVTLDQFERRWHCDGLTLCSLPGVFSHGRLDDGTALLLDTLADITLHGPVLDIGCGAGILTAQLARRGLEVSAVDVSTSAVAATERSLAANDLTARVYHSDLYSGLPGGAGAPRFRTVISNPPFHDGLAHHTGITQRLISEAPRHLQRGGSLWLVANQGLPYGDWLAQHFAQVTVAQENRRFRVWHARLQN